MAVVVYLAEGWFARQLCGVDHFRDAIFSFVTVLLLNWLVVLHLALKVPEVFPQGLAGQNGLLFLSLADLLLQDFVCSVALFQTSFNVADQLELFPLHVAYLGGEACRLTIVVVYVGLHILGGTGPLIMQVLLLPLNSFFVKLELALLFAHRVGQLF